MTCALAESDHSAIESLMMKGPRFHLLSLLAGILVSGILLGINVLPRIQKTRSIPGQFPMLISLDSEELPSVDVSEPHIGTVFVTQGWPYFLREEEAWARVLKPGDTPRVWSWSGKRTVVWEHLATNLLIVLVIAASAGAAVEWLLRRRDASRGSAV